MREIVMGETVCFKHGDESEEVRMMYEPDSKEMSAIRNLAKRGLVENKPWVLEKCAEAIYRLPPDLHLLAMVWASAHPWALDYIQQAPIILPILRIQYGPYPSRRRQQELSKRVGRRCKEKLQLKEVMARMEIPYPLRKFQYPYIYEVTNLPLNPFRIMRPSVLSQVIPEAKREQAMWLGDMVRWDFRFNMRGGPYEQGLWEWIAKITRNIQGAGLIDEWTDYIMTVGYNPNWSIGTLATLSEAWHGEIEVEDREASFMRLFGRRWDERIGDEKWPDRFTVKHVSKGDIVWEFVALRSGRDLAEEGKAMHNCVATYAESVMSGVAMLYSMRDDEGKRFATVEYSCLNGLVSQIKGPCNAILPKVFGDIAGQALMNAFDKGGPWQTMRVSLNIEEARKMYMHDGV